MTKLRVAFFAEILLPDFDGAVRTMYQIIRRIPKERFEFLFICGVGPGKIEGFECVTIPSFTLPINVNYKMALPGLAQSRLKQKLRDFRPDVIHIATPALLGAFACNYAQAARLPVMTIYHTHFISYVDYYLKHTPFLIGLVKQQITAGQRAFYNQCSQVNVPSESMADELRRIGVESSRIQLWKRGIDTRLFHPGKRDRDRMAAITGNDAPIILFASRLVWEKNLETLFSIYQVLQERNLPYQLVVAGSGLAEKACRQRMPKAIFTGKVDHERLSVLYASSDAFVFPSVSETYGNVVLEAMASGLPCVIADGGGSRDFVENGVNGFRCSPFDARDYVDKLQLLLESPALLQQFSENGLTYSRTHSWDRLTATYFADLTRLADHPELEMVV